MKNALFKKLSLFYWEWQISHQRKWVVWVSLYCVNFKIHLFDNIVTSIEDTKGNWVDISVFYIVHLTAGDEIYFELKNNGMLAGGEYSQILVRKIG